MDITFNAFHMPVFSANAVTVLRKVASGSFQEFPATVEGHDEAYAIINFTQCCNCLDESLSEFDKYSENDPVRPDRAGEYRQITRLVIDPQSVRGKPIFRLWGHMGIVIVSDAVKCACEAAKLTGIEFRPAT